MHRACVNFIHEPVLRRRPMAATCRVCILSPQDHEASIGPIIRASVGGDRGHHVLPITNDSRDTKPPNPPCPSPHFTPAGDGSFRKPLQRLGFTPKDSCGALLRSTITTDWRLRHHVWLLHFRFGPRGPERESALAGMELYSASRNGLPQGLRSAASALLRTGLIGATTDSARRCRFSLLQRTSPKTVGRSLQRRQQFQYPKCSGPTSLSNRITTPPTHYMLQLASARRQRQFGL